MVFDSKKLVNISRTQHVANESILTRPSRSRDWNSLLHAKGCMLLVSGLHPFAAKNRKSVVEISGGLLGATVTSIKL